REQEACHIEAVASSARPDQGEVRAEPPPGLRDPSQRDRQRPRSADPRERAKERRARPEVGQEPQVATGQADRVRAGGPRPLRGAPRGTRLDVGPVDPRGPGRAATRRTASRRARTGTGATPPAAPGDRARRGPRRAVPIVRLGARTRPPRAVASPRPTRWWTSP